MVSIWLKISKDLRNNNNQSYITNWIILGFVWTERFVVTGMKVFLVMLYHTIGYGKR